MQELKGEKKANENNQPIDPSEEVIIDERLKKMNAGEKDLPNAPTETRPECTEVVQGLKKIDVKI